MGRHFLLICGIVSSLFYFALNLFVPMCWDEYDVASQTVSELSAIGAPTRSLWIGGILMYTVLLVAFGWGVRQSGKGLRHIRLVGTLIILHAIFGLFWPPMHSREVLAAGGGTMTDTLHIAWTAVTIPMFMIEMWLGGRAFGTSFRLYSILSILITIVFGILTGIMSPDMEADRPTPWMGIFERISIASYMIWLMVFAMLLIRHQPRWIQKLNV